MTVCLQHVDGEYKLVLTPEQVEALQVAEGDVLELLPMKVNQSSPVRRGVTYASVEEVMEAHRATERSFTNAYRELAK